MRERFSCLGKIRDPKAREEAFTGKALAEPQSSGGVECNWFPMSELGGT